jgi:hypothetical protein
MRAQPASVIWKLAKAKALVKDWEGARNLIKPHIFPAPDDSLAPGLIQLYALSNFRTGDVVTALVSNDRLESEYPNWHRIGNSRFLRGEIYFSRQKYEQAWAAFDKAGPAFEGRLHSFLTLRYPSIPKDSLNFLLSGPGLGNSMASRVVQNLQSKEEISASGPKSPPEVALILPLDLKKIKDKGTEGSAAEFCRGFLLATEMLSAQDSALRLHIFDYENDEKKLEKMISGNAFQGLDVAIGPVKGNAVKILEKAMKKNKTLLLNPLAMPAIPSDSGYALHLQPSPRKIAAEAFDFISGFSLGKKVGIIYGIEKNDSLKALAYKDLMKKMGREVSLFKKVGKNSAANLTKFLGEAGLDSTSHLFVPNSEAMVKAQLLGAYSWTKARYPVLIAGNWLESSQADFDEYARQLIFFLNPDLPFPQSDSKWKEWQSNYVAKYGSPPTWIAWKGFDLACTLSRVWYSSQGNFEAMKSEKGASGPLFGYYRFSEKNHENQYIPIYQVNEEGVHRVWPKEE